MEDGVMQSRRVRPGGSSQEDSRKMTPQFIRKMEEYRQIPRHLHNYSTVDTTGKTGH